MSRGDPQALERGALVATAGTALSRITGFARLASMTYALGVVESKLADTYQLANTTPNIVYELVLGGVLSSVLQRTYVEIRSTQGQQEAWRFLSRLSKVAALMLAGMTLVGIVVAPVIFGLYTSSGSAAAQREIGTFLLRLFVPQILFYGFGTISTAVLNAHRSYGPPMFAPVLNNLVVIATFLTFASVVPTHLRDLGSVTPGALVLLGLGTTLGVALQGIGPWLFLRRLGYRGSWSSGLRDPRFRRLAGLSVFMVGYVVTNQLGLWVAMKLANYVQGGVAGYAAAYVFFQLPHGLLAVSIAVVIFTGMTESAVSQDVDSFARQLNQGLRAIAFCILPAVAGYIALAPRIVAVTLEHGVATRASTDLISTTLRAWAIGIFFFSSFYLMLRAFYALGDTRTPMLINLAAFVVNVAVDLVLFFSLDSARMRIAGLAIGHATSYLVAAIAGMVLVSRRSSREVARGLGSTVGRVGLASTLTGVAAYFTAGLIDDLFGRGSAAELLSVTGGTLAGLLVYVAVARLLRLEEMRWIAKLILRRA